MSLAEELSRDQSNLCKALKKPLEKRHIAISMDGKGRAIDNVFIERLWRSVKYEHVYLNVSDDGNHLWKGINEYFRFYNQQRLHQNLNYLTPEEVYHAKEVAA